MGRQGTGVELREKSIRVSFTLAGKVERVTLKLIPTPANERAAVKLMVRVRTAIANGTFTWADYFPEAPQAKAAAPGSTKTFGDWCDLWLETKGRLALNTLNQYRNACTVWKGILGQDTAMAKLNHATVAAKIGVTPFASPKLLNNYLIVLRGVFKLAGRTMKVENPMDGIENSKSQAIPPDPLSVEDMERVLVSLREHYDKRVWAYFEFAFMTGMRPEELIALRWGDVDWASGTIRVERARTAGEEKALKTYMVRDVDLVERAVSALNYMKPWTYLAGQRTEESELGGHIFQHPETERPWNDERAQRDTFWRPTLRRLGMRWRRPYQTRHTYAANGLLAGVNPSYISKQMGHANAKMLFTVYAKWIDGADRGREKAKLEAMLKGKNSSLESPRESEDWSSSEGDSGRRDWTRTNDPHHVKVVL